MTQQRSATTRIRRALATAVAVPLAVASAPLLTAGPAAAATSCSSSGITIDSLNAPVFYTDSSATPSVLDSGYAGYTISSSSARRDVWVQLSGFTGGALALNPDQPAALPLGDLPTGGSAPAFYLLTGTPSATAQTHTVSVYAGRPGSSGSTLLCSGSGGFAGVVDTIQAAANKVQDVTGDGAPASVSTTSPQLGGTVTVTVEGTTGTIGSGPTTGTLADPNGVYMTPTALSSFPANAFRLVGTSLTISPDGTAPPVTYTNLLRLGPLGSPSRDYVATYTFRIVGTTTSNTTIYPIQQIASGTQIKHTNTSSLGTSIPPIQPVSNPLTVALSASPSSFTAGGGTAHVTQTLRSTASVQSSADALVGVLPTGAAYVAGSAKLGGVSVPDPSVSGSTLTFAGPFTTSSTSPAVLTYDVNVPATVGSYQLQGTGLLGSTVLDTTGATDNPPTYHAPVPATVTLAVGQQSQAITFPTMPDTTLDEPAPVPAASADSGLPVSYSSSTPSVCTVSPSGVVSLVDSGTCTLTADQAGDETHSAATPVSQSFTVNPAAPVEPVVPIDPVVPEEPVIPVMPVMPQPQTITFPTMPDTTIDGIAPVPAATADSGLPVSYSSSTSSVCTVTPTGVVTLVGTGTCTLTAMQSGNGSYLPAGDVERSFTVAPAPVIVPVVPDVPGIPVPIAPEAQTITFPSISDAFVDGTAPTPTASATSGLPVSYSSSTPLSCTVNPTGVVTLVGAGNCTLTAMQAGDSTHLPAVPVSRTFAIRRHPQSITFPALADAVLTRPAPTPAAAASSGLPVTYSTTTPATCAVTNGAVTLVSSGTCTIVASQPGNGVFDAASTASRSFTVLAPPPLTVQPGGASTVGVSPGTVQLPGLPSNAVVHLPANVTTTVPGLAAVTVQGTSVKLTAKPTFSGVISLPVTITVNGQSASTVVRLVVSPNPETVPMAGLRDASHTSVSWKASLNATGYEVRIGGRVVCVTKATSCSVVGLLGPKAGLTVTALGGSGTRSVAIKPAYRSGAPIRVAGVYFASDSAALSASARQTLDQVVATIRTQGFVRLSLVGNTDSRASYLYNLVLSRRRAEVVQSYITHRLSGAGVKLAVAYHSENTPAATNATARGRALNRRTDISLS